MVETRDASCQSDPSTQMEEKYLNSYQMLLGEQQEVRDMTEKLHEEVERNHKALKRAEEEGLRRVRVEEEGLRQRMEEVEDIISQEKQQIDEQWGELREAQRAAYAVHAEKTEELLQLMHLVSAHHEKLQSDKKKVHTCLMSVILMYWCDCFAMVCILFDNAVL